MVDFSSYPVLYSESIAPVFVYLRESFFEIWKCSIPFWIHIDDREYDFWSTTILEEFFIYLRPSADKSFLLIVRTEIFIEFFYRADNCNSRKEELSASKNDIFSTREDSPYRFEGFSPHDDRISCRCFFEVFEVFRDIPRDFSLISDDTIVCHGSYGDIANWWLVIRGWKYMIIEKPCNHDFFIILYLTFELFETREFPILTDFKEWSHRYHLPIDISLEVEKMRLKKLRLFQIYAYTIVCLSWNNPRKSIGTCFEITTATRKWYIRCRKSDRMTELLSFYDDAGDGTYRIIHVFFLFQRGDWVQQ